MSNLLWALFQYRALVINSDPEGTRDLWSGAGYIDDGVSSDCNSEFGKCGWVNREEDLMDIMIFVKTVTRFRY